MQIYSAACKVEASYELPDLSTALRQIQSQYDSIAAKNLEVRCHFLVIKKHNPFCFCHKNMPDISSQGCGDSEFFQDMDTWYRSKFQDLSNTSTKHVESVRSVRDEINGHKRDVSMIFYLLPPVLHSFKIWFGARAQILGKERELDSLKKRNEYLEAQIRDAVEKYKKEEEDLQVLNI